MELSCNSFGFGVQSSFLFVCLFFSNCGHKMGKSKTLATVVCDISSVNLAYAVLE